MNDESLRGAAKYWGVWPTVLWSIGIAVIVIVAQYAVLIAALPPLDPRLSEEESLQIIKEVAESGTVVSLAVIFSFFCGSAVIAFAVKLKRGARWPEYLGLDVVPSATLMRWLVLAAVYLALMDLLTVSLDRELVPKFQTDLYTTTNPRWLVWVVIVAVAPLFEEALFRGFLYRGLSASWLATSGSILITSLVWASLHWQYDFYGITQIFVFGVFLGIARVRTASLVTPLAIHVLANLLSTLETAIAVASSNT